METFTYGVRRGKGDSQRHKPRKTSTYRHSLGLDLFEFSLNDYDLLFVFSGDSDLVPAIQRAKLRSKVVAVVSRKQPARRFKEMADGILYLEDVIDLIPAKHIVRKQTKTPKEERVVHVQHNQSELSA